MEKTIAILPENRIQTFGYCMVETLKRKNTPSTQGKIPTIWDIVMDVYIDVKNTKIPLPKSKRDPMKDELNDYFNRFIEITMSSKGGNNGSSKGGRISPPETDKIPQTLAQVIIQKIYSYIEWVKALLERNPHLWALFLFLLSFLMILIFLWKRGDFQRIVRWFRNTEEDILFEVYKHSKRVKRLPKPPIQNLEEREEEKVDRLKGVRELLKKIHKSTEKLEKIAAEKASRRKSEVIQVQKEQRMPEIIDLPPVEISPSVKISLEEKVYQNPWKKVQPSGE